MERLDNVPQELRDLPHWHCWVRNSEGTKIPVQVTGVAAKSNDPQTWTTFTAACEASGKFEGIATEIVPPYCGVDLDNCFDDTGSLRPWAAPIVSQLMEVAYGEVSPSGQGIKFITRGRKPEGSRCKHIIENGKQQLECYDHARFWTMTGDVYGGCYHISDGQAAVDWICEKYLGRDIAPAKQNSNGHGTVSVNQHNDLHRRAESWLAKCDGVGDGSRNNAAFSIAGHIRAFVDDYDNRLNAEQITDLMQSWNDRNSPPLSVGELRDAVESSIRNGTPRPDKPPQKRQADRVDLSGIIGQAKNNGDGKPEADPFDLGFIDSAEFASRTYSSDWLVQYVLKDAQPCIIAGPSKTLKTNISIELCVSLAAGRPFFGRNEARQCTVALASAESGEETLQETANRVCASKGIGLASLSRSLLWTFRPPQIDVPVHIAGLKAFITENEVSVLVIDPAYLSMSIGDGAKNQFLVGAVLQNLSYLQAETGVLPVLNTHTTKNIPVGQELELADIAYAGFGQWARQWFLLNRRERYDREQPGNHRLFFSFGGSAGHAGSWALDIDEGDIRTGRKWEYSITSAADVCRDNAEAQAEVKAERERRRREVAYEERRGRILAAFRKLSGPQREKQIREAAGLSGQYFKPIWIDLLNEGTIGSVGDRKAENGRSYEHFEIVNPGDQ